MKKVVLIFGTRPEAVKMCPVVIELKKRRNIQTIVCITGQHREMLAPVMDVFNIKEDYNLDIMTKGQTLFDVTIKAMLGIKEVLEKETPDIVMVHGDTTTALAGAVSAFYMRCAVFHVEAGLRTYDIYSPYPEEFNRRVIGLVSEYHFAPTELCRNNLICEGISSSKIFVSGNTVIDSLKYTIRKEYSNDIIRWARGSRLIVLTAHRRENFGMRLLGMLRAVSRIAKSFSDVKIVYPVHMNPNVESALEAVSFGENVRLSEPMSVMDFHNTLAVSYFVMTDSGGVQEEASWLGKPVLVMRDTTERPEGLDAGGILLVGTDEEKIYNAAYELLTNNQAYNSMSCAPCPFGDGNAADRIADAVSDLFDIQ